MENTKTEKIAQIQEQLEFYLSDGNLSRDQFFYSKISDNAEGWLLIELIENCNKIKNLSASREDILEAIKASELLDLNEQGDSLRRAGNKDLPEFKAQKKLRVANNDAGVAVNNQDKDAKTHVKAPVPDNIMEPLILFLRDIDGLYKKGRSLEEEISKKFMIKVPFARIGKSEDGGQVLFDKNNTSEEIVNELLNDGFVFEGRTLKFDRGTDRDRDYFFKEHSRHVNNILKRKFKKKLGRADRDVKRKWQGSLKFLEVTYPSLEAFKSKFKGLIMKTKNGDEIGEAGSALLKELLTHHTKTEEKMANFKAFTVDFHPNYQTTRCFFVIREDGTKDDFSYHKCIHNLINKLD